MYNVFLFKRETMSRQRQKKKKTLNNYAPIYFLAQFLLKGISGKQEHSGSNPHSLWTNAFIESLLGEQCTDSWT